MAATAASRVLGLVREQVMLAVLGLNAGMGAFTVAFKVPSLVRTLLADTALSAAFIPVFSELLEKGRRAEAWMVARTIILLATLVLGSLSLLGMAFAPQVISLVAPGFKDPATIALAVDLTRIMFLSVVVLGVAGVFMGILNTLDQFTLPALAPIVWNVVIIGSLAFYWLRYGAPGATGEDQVDSWVAVMRAAAVDYRGFYALAWGVMLGTVAELAIQVPAVWRRMEGPALSVALRHPAVRQIGRLLFPVVLSLGIVNFNALIDTIVASYIPGETAPAVIDKAFRLFQLPQGMFAVAIGTVLFPTLSRLGATGRITEFRSTLSAGTRQIFFVTLPFTAFFLVLGVPTVRLVFQHGNVTSADTRAMAWALAGFSVGMAFISANTLLNRAFYSIQKPWLPLSVGVVNLALNAALDLLLYRPLGVGGITLATSVVSTFNFLALSFLLRRQIEGIDGRRVATSVLRSAVAMVFLAVAAYSAWWLLDNWLGRSVPAQLVSVGVGYAAGLAGYVLGARLLRMSELQEVIDAARRRRRTPRAVADASGDDSA
jgi:putative peptidoglycan lipid II flippase